MNQALLRSMQRQFGSANFDAWQTRRWTYWDYARLPVAGTTSVSLFNNPSGSTDPVSTLRKTSEQTNLVKGASFGQVYFFIQQVRTHIHVLPKVRQPTGINNNASLVFGTLSDMMSKVGDLMNAGVLNMQIGQKSYLQIDRAFLNAPPGFGMEVYQWAGNRVAPTYYTQQNNAQKDVYELPDPQCIEPDQTFQVTIDFDTATPDFTSTVSSANPAIDIGVIFDGYIARPAQ